MKKLKLEEIAPYLPYKLKIIDTIKLKSKVMNLGQGTSSNWIGIKTVLSTNSIYKPILRPLDLTKEIECKGVKIIPLNIILEDNDFFDSIKLLSFDNDNYIEMKGQHMITQLISVDNMPYQSMVKLFEWHFDIFGLIPRGLAIDINTI